MELWVEFLLSATFEVSNTPRSVRHVSLPEQPLPHLPDVWAVQSSFKRHFRQEL